MWGWSIEFWDVVFRISTITAFLLGGLGVSAAFVSAWVGYELSDIVQQDANKKIAEANARSDEANSRTQQLEKDAAEARLEQERLKASMAWRRLTREQYDEIVGALRRSGGTLEISVSTPVGDPEAHLYSDDITRALLGGGVKIRGETAAIERTARSRLLSSDSVIAGSDFVPVCEASNALVLPSTVVREHPETLLRRLCRFLCKSSRLSYAAGRRGLRAPGRTMCRSYAPKFAPDASATLAVRRRTARPIQAAPEPSGDAPDARAGDAVLLDFAYHQHYLRLAFFELGVDSAHKRGRRGADLLVCARRPERIADLHCAEWVEAEPANPGQRNRDVVFDTNFNHFSTLSVGEKISRGWAYSSGQASSLPAIACKIN